MKITTLPEALEGDPVDPSRFNGPASAHALHRSTEPQSVNIAVVRFEAGSRNHWHRHAGGQLLHVVEGKGWVQSRGESARRIRTGDSVSADPGEEHWHGAGPDAAMAHIAVSLGEATFLEPSDGPPSSGA